MGEKLRESMVYPLTTGWWRDSLSKHDQCAQHLTAVIRRVCRKSPVGAVVFLRYFPLCVSSSLVTSDSRGNGLEFRSMGEEPHQPLEVLHGCRKIELLAYEAHPA